MPQRIRPSLSSDVTQINKVISVCCKDGMWYYFLGEYPIHSHRVDDLKMFEIITSQLIENELCRQIDIIKTFGVTRNRVVRASRKLEQGGLAAFFSSRKIHRSSKGRRRRGWVLTPDVLQQAQLLLDQEYTRQQVAQELNVSFDTIRKACKDGRLQEKKRAAK